MKIQNKFLKFVGSKNKVGNYKDKEEIKHQHQKNDNKKND